MTIFKIIMVLGLCLVLSPSCTKQDTWLRNYMYPIDLNNPTGPQIGGNIVVEKGMLDEIIINKIRVLTDPDLSEQAHPIMYLATYIYTSGIDSKYIDIDNPDCRYMLFPHSINSMSDKWGWEYYKEYQELRNEHGKKKGEEIFCDLYLDGNKTLGMLLD